MQIYNMDHAALVLLQDSIIILDLFISPSRNKIFAPPPPGGGGGGGKDPPSTQLSLIMGCTDSTLISSPPPSPGVRLKFEQMLFFAVREFALKKTNSAWGLKLFSGKLIYVKYIFLIMQCSCLIQSTII
jgi:hypothetical protein